MKHDEFVARVRDLAELETNEEAERAIKPTFETLKTFGVSSEITPTNRRGPAGNDRVVR